MPPPPGSRNSAPRRAPLACPERAERARLRCPQAAARGGGAGGAVRPNLRHMLAAGVDTGVAALAAQQHGCVSHRQVRHLGLTAAQVRGRLRCRQWAEPLPKVYRLAGVPLSWRGEVCAVALAAGAGVPGRALASHRTALHLHAPERFDRPDVVEVCAPRNQGRDVPGAVVRERRDLACDASTVQGIGCTTGERAVLDVAALLDETDATALVDDAIAAKVARRSALHRRARTIARLRQSPLVAALTAPGAERVFRSVMERDGTALLEGADLGGFTVNVVLYDGRGRIREVDVYWPEDGLVLEWDGLRFHSSAAQRARDQAGDRRLVVTRRRVLRFGWIDQRRRPDVVIRDVGEALGRPSR